MPSSFPGYVKPSQFAVDAGVIYIGATPVGIGATEGGLQWDPGTEYHHPEFDGMSAEIETLHRVVDYSKNKLSGDILDLTGVNVGRYQPGATSDGSTGTNIITPIDAFTFFSTGAYLTDVSWILRRSDNTTIWVFAAVALVKKFQLKTTPKKEGKASIEIVACLSSTETDLSKCPFVYKDLDT